MIKLAKEQHGDQSNPSLQRGSVSHVVNNDRGALANYGSQTIGTGKGSSTHYGKCFLCHD